MKIERASLLEMLKSGGNESLLKYLDFSEEEYEKVTVEGGEKLIAIMDTYEKLLYDEELKRFYFFKPIEGTKEGDEVLREKTYITELDKLLNSFDSTDVLLKDLLIDRRNIFPNNAVGATSKEMEGLYIIMNVAGIMGEPFKEEVAETIKGYDFKKWKGQIDDLFDDELNFEKLVQDAIRAGGMKVKMIVSACKYSLKEEKNNVISFRTSELATDQIIDLENTRNKIKQIRLTYDITFLNPEKRKGMEKWEILQKIFDQDAEIKLLMDDLKEKGLEEIFRVFKLTSSCMEPSAKKRLLSSARSQLRRDIQTVGRFEDGQVADTVFKKKYLKTLEGKLLSAWTRKFRTEQIHLFNSDQGGYKAPRVLKEEV
jgi:hypothetical protein